jgi:hypothetical protein
VKWAKRGLMAVTLINFVACIWFAQYIVTGWLVGLYVLGSLALAIGGMILAE